MKLPEKLCVQVKNTEIKLKLIPNWHPPLLDRHQIMPKPLPSGSQRSLRPTPLMMAYCYLTTNFKHFSQSPTRRCLKAKCTSVLVYDQWGNYQNLHNYAKESILFHRYSDMKHIQYATEFESLIAIRHEPSYSGTRKRGGADGKKNNSYNNYNNFSNVNHCQNNGFMLSKQFVVI